MNSQGFRVNLDGTLNANIDSKSHDAIDAIEYAASQMRTKKGSTPGWKISEHWNKLICPKYLVNHIDSIEIAGNVYKKVNKDNPSEDKLKEHQEKKNNYTIDDLRQKLINSLYEKQLAGYRQEDVEIVKILFK